MTTPVIDNQKPTLLVLASTFPRWKNDTEPRFVYDLCQHLKKVFSIIVLAPHCINAKNIEELEDLKVIRYRYAPEKLETLAYEGGVTAKLKGNKLNYLILPFFFVGQWLAITKLLRQHPIKAIHAHWLIPQGILALMARHSCKNKPAILCTSHGGDLYGLNDPVSKAIKRYVINKVNTMTVVSTAMQGEVKSLVPDADLPTVAPMGTDLHNLFTPDPLVQRKPYQLLFVGRLVEKKGLKYLINALPYIVKIYPKTVLNIAGTGPEQPALELQLKKLSLEKHANFLGRLSHKELIKQYRQASLAVFPFVKAKDGDIEGLGLVMIEAMGCGCPVVASDIPAVRDVVINLTTGVLAPPTDSEKLANILNELFETPERMQLLSYTARSYVLKHFSWKKSSERYIEILNNLCN